MSAFKSILLYGLSVAIVKGVGLLMLPFTTAYVDIEQYGVLNLISSFIAIAGLILTFGLGETLYRYASHHSQAQQQQVFAWCFSLCCLGSVVFLLIGLLATKSIIGLFPLSVSQNQFFYTLVTLCFSALTTVPYAIWRFNGAAGRYFVFTVGCCLTHCCLSIILLMAGLGIDGVLIAGAISQVCWSGLLLWQFRSLLSLRVLRQKLVRWQYALSIMLASCISYFLQGSEQWIIAGAIGAEALATYFIAAQLGVAVLLVVEPYKMWWFAKRHRALRDENINNPLYSVLGTELCALSAMLLMLAMPLLLPLLLAANYLGALNWLGWLAVIAVIKSHSELLNLGCYVKLDGKAPIIINAISAVIVISLSLHLVQGYGLAGVIGAMVLTHVIRACLYLVVSQILLYQQYNYIRLCLLWGFLALSLYCYENNLVYWAALLACLYALSIVMTYRQQCLPLLTSVSARIGLGTRSVFHG